MRRNLFQNIFTVVTFNQNILAAKHLAVLLSGSLIIYLLSACAPLVSFQVVRPPIQQVENIKYIEIGDFQIVSGQIKLTTAVESAPSSNIQSSNKTLQPSITKFNSNHEDSFVIADLVRAALIHELSLNSQHQLLNTTGEEVIFSSVVPDAAEVAVLTAKVKYSEHIFQAQEELSYFTSIKNKGATLEQSLLASAVSMGAESSGAGFLIPTPYVEQVAALEVEFSLLRKSDGRDVVAPQKFHSFYISKWGGDPDTSHLPYSVKRSIIKNYQFNKKVSEPVISRIDRAGLSFSNPAEYFARGFNLKQNVQVPQTSLDIKISLGRQVTQKYVKQIVPFYETADLKVQNGNPVAATLIRGNAYQEAVAFLQGLDIRSAEDEYNLGLAFEADGQILSAGKHYILALQQDKSNPVYSEAVKRTELPAAK